MNDWDDTEEQQQQKKHIIFPQRIVASFIILTDGNILVFDDYNSCLSQLSNIPLVIAL